MQNHHKLLLFLYQIFRFWCWLNTWFRHHLISANRIFDCHFWWSLRPCFVLYFWIFKWNITRLFNSELKRIVNNSMQILVYQPMLEIRLKIFWYCISNSPQDVSAHLETLSKRDKAKKGTCRGSSQARDFHCESHFDAI